jgi:hypothetical protein
MCLDEAGQERLESCRCQPWYVWYLVKLVLHEVVFAPEPAEHHTDRRAVHTATENKVPRIELVVDLGLLEKPQHLRWRYDQATFWLVVFRDVESDSPQKLA